MSPTKGRLGRGLASLGPASHGPTYAPPTLHLVDLPPLDPCFLEGCALCASWILGVAPPPASAVPHLGSSTSPYANHLAWDQGRRLRRREPLPCQVCGQRHPPGATLSLLGQPLCPWSSPNAPGANPKTQGHPPGPPRCCLRICALGDLVHSWRIAGTGCRKQNACHRRGNLTCSHKG